MSPFIKCISSEEMARVENLAIAAGCSEMDFMEKAGRGVAEACQAHEPKLLKKGVTLFAGTGNNGADAFVAGRYLLEAGASVEAFFVATSQHISPLCEEQRRCFTRAGGIIHEVTDKAHLPTELEGVIIDGLVGTGFKTPAQPLLLHAIERINTLKCVVFSVDIPSGLSGTHGKMTNEAVTAHYTVYLEMAKIGFFTGGGWEYVGKLIRVGFGLPKAYSDMAQAQALLPTPSYLKSLLPSIKRCRHKYEAGYVIGWAGASSMAGAASLSSTAAIHAGAGIVRLFYTEGIDPALLATAVEVIKEKLILSDLSSIYAEMKRAKSFFIGPGLGREPPVMLAIAQLLNKLSIPAVIDADALYYLAEHPSAFPPPLSILTPHRGEMQRLLETWPGRKEGEDLQQACSRYAKEKKVVLILKGAPTFIFDGDTPAVIIPYGDPGMATAGSGDVLTGVLAAMLAEGLPPKEAAILGVYLHAVAGERAAREKTSFCMVASDIIDYLPRAFKTLLYKAKE